jgi:hypothetical protein
MAYPFIQPTKTELTSLAAQRLVHTDEDARERPYDVG